jgi:hypothetical protein
VGGALERRGAPSLGGGFSCEREATSKARTKTRQVQRQARVQRKQRIMIKTKQARGRRLTKARGALLHKACGKVFEELQGTKEWLLLYQVHLFMFPVLYILL